MKSALEFLSFIKDTSVFNTMVVSHLTDKNLKKVYKRIIYIYEMIDEEKLYGTLEKLVDNETNGANHKMLSNSLTIHFDDILKSKLKPEV